MGSERRGLRCHALHQTAIAANGINVVVEDLETGPVVSAGEPLLRDRHADACGHALSQRAGRGLDAGYPVILRMTRRLTVELTETADVVDRDRGLSQPFIIRVHCLCAGQMEYGPEQHR